MQTSRVFVNNRTNEEFITTVMHNLNNELCQGKTATGKTFVAKLVGYKTAIDGTDVFLFQIKNGDILVNRVADIVGIRKFDPNERDPKPQKLIPRSTRLVI
jgi:hypothetical protein